MANLQHPTDLKYSKTDEWIRVEGDQVVIGITDYAQDQLGDIVYIELPWEAGSDLTHDGKFGDIESVKATSELISPVSGDIVKTNEELREHPEYVNDDPYQRGWMLTVKLSNPSELDQLMSVNEYLSYIQER